MKHRYAIPLLGTFALSLLLAVAWLLLPAGASMADPAPTIVAVQPDVSAGKARLEILVSESGKPVTSAISVVSSRLDMGPDGMETMTAPLTPVASKSPGIVAFDADVSMAGRWALTVTLTVAGRKEPIKGKVVFNVGERHSGADKPHAASREVAYYRNPMGLADTSPVPKKDSMGMDYIPVYEDERAQPGSVRIPSDKLARAGIRTAKVERMRFDPVISVPGIVAFNEAMQGAVTIKFSGFVEELLVPATGAHVRAGQPLVRVWIESPEVLQKFADLIAQRGAAPFEGAEEAARRNLRLLGIPDAVIDQVERTGVSTRSIVLPALVGGTVIEKPAVVGMRFSPGDTLYRVTDLSRMWVIADIPERDLARLRTGQTARITLNAYKAAPVTGKVALVYPELDMATRTARARIEVPNPDGALKAGLYADVDIDTGADGAAVLAIPSAAVIDDGERRIVFVMRENGLFEARPVQTGGRAGDMVEVRVGLSAGETVVAKGNFLIDAESNLQAALASLPQ